MSKIHFEQFEKQLNELNGSIHEVGFDIDLALKSEVQGVQKALIEHQMEEVRHTLEQRISEVKRLQDGQREGRERLKILMGLYSEMVSKVERLRQLPHEGNWDLPSSNSSIYHEN